MGKSEDLPSVVRLWKWKIPKRFSLGDFFIDQKEEGKIMNEQLASILNGIEPVASNWIEKATAKTAQLVMPPRALGRLHDMAEQLCGIQQTLEPVIDRKAVLVMAGDHGVVAEGVNPFPQEITGEMVRTFLINGAGINALAKCVDAQVWVADMGVIPDLELGSLENRDRLFDRKIQRGTANLAQGPAMSIQDAEKSILTGFELAKNLFEEGINILGTGDMGIGNTTPSAAVGAVITDTDVNAMVGRGTGADDEGLARKQAAVQKGIQVNHPDPNNGLDVLSKIGGFEIGGIAGSILAAAFHHCPVVVDGFISTAGALIAHALCSRVKDYMFAGHCSEELGHRAMLDFLGLHPILDLNMRLGEGTGGVLAMGVLDGAVQVFKDVLTFEQAGVTEKEG